MLGARRDTVEDLEERARARRDPYVLAAQREGESWETIWRMAYSLPPNDPRYLDMPEDEMLRDLLVRMFHQEHLHRMLNPAEAGQEELQTSLAAQDGLEALRQRVLAHVVAGQRARQAEKDAKEAQPKPAIKRGRKVRT